MKVLVTGANGFIGKNLILALKMKSDIEIITYTRNSSDELLIKSLNEADFIFHLAGENRPKIESEFDLVNHGLTKKIVNYLTENNKSTPIVYTSSTQATSDNAYGRSKSKAEEELLSYSGVSYIYRLSNVFGKWCKPNYNSAISTFMYNIARGLEVTISNREHELSLIYIDDIVAEFMEVLSGKSLDTSKVHLLGPIHKTTLGELVKVIFEIKDSVTSSVLGDFSDTFYKKLYSTYLSYLPPEQLRSSVDLKVDDRGNLFELIKSVNSGQVFVSKTKKGVTRGNHYHNTKVEKFCVIQGQANISFRHMVTEDKFDFDVSGDQASVINIPPGVTHSIKNTGDGEMICIFWANEVFNPKEPDTYFSEVDNDK